MHHKNNCQHGLEDKENVVTSFDSQVLWLLHDICNAVSCDHWYNAQSWNRQNGLAKESWSNYSQCNYFCWNAPFWRN